MMSQLSGTDLDSKRIQLVITECDTTDGPKVVDDDYSNALGQKMVRAKIHALVPESICRPSESMIQKDVRCPAVKSKEVGRYEENKICCGGGRVEEPIVGMNEAMTQTKETRIISAAELESLCSGKRAKGFPRESDDQTFNFTQPDSSSCPCHHPKQKRKCCKSKCRKPPEPCKCHQPKPYKQSFQSNQPYKQTPCQYDNLPQNKQHSSKSRSPEPCEESCRAPCNATPQCCKCGKRQQCPARQPRNDNTRKKCRCPHCQQSRSKCVIQ